MTVFFGIIAVITLLMSIAGTFPADVRNTAKQCFWVSAVAMVVIKIASLIS